VKKNAQEIGSALQMARFVRAATRGRFESSMKLAASSAPSSTAWALRFARDSAGAIEQVQLTGQFGKSTLALRARENLIIGSASMQPHLTRAPRRSELSGFFRGRLSRSSWCSNPLARPRARRPGGPLVARWFAAQRLIR